MAPTRAAPARLWLKVGLCLVLLDLLLFRFGLLWRLDVRFPGGLGSITWVNVFQISRILETRPRTPGTAVVAGSSVVWAGVNTPLMNRRFHDDHVDVDVATLAAFGSSCSDSAVIAWQGLTLDPWLVVYGAAARDFKKAAVTDTPITRILYDGAIEVPALARHGVEERLDAQVKRWWRLYRYRFFVRSAFATASDDLFGTLFTGPTPAFADPPPAAGPAPAPPEAAQWFLPTRVNADSFAAWQRWRASGRFADYEDWLRATGGHVLDEYQKQTVANFGPDDNPQADALRWMLATLRRREVRTVLVYFPENPAFRDPAARAYFDPALSAAYADFFAREGARAGARVVDLRDLLAPEDFYDLIHPNLQGMWKLSARLAEIVEEEWRARAQSGGRS